MVKRLAIAAAFTLFIVAPALAQAPAGPPPVRVRGTVDTLNGDTLMVKARDGSSVKVALTDKTRLQALVKKSLADIKAGDFLASTGVKGKDGKIHAIEVRIFPQAQPDGGRQFAWDLGSDSVMTNATVGTLAEAPEGRVVHVKFTGGESEYTIGPEVPILAPIPADRSLLKPGAAVFFAGPKAADGTVTATFMYVEKDGVKPPM